MPEPALPKVEWIILTMGDRPHALAAAVASVRTDGVAIVWNGTSAAGVDTAVRSVEAAANLGVPGGRDLGARTSDAPVLAFLDDDAVAAEGVGAMIADTFDRDQRVGAIALRLVDEAGRTARRHVPRFGGRHPDRGGDVTLFLGGACAIRHEAYEDAGGYWGDLFYGHEEVELCWRLIDHGWRIVHLPDATVFHPRTDIGRHADGWRMTGRNRVMVARRTLPWPVAVVHVAAWLGIGMLRAPGRDNRAAYFRGWRSGWAQPVERRPIRWRTVVRLTRLGRPPIL